jgi:glycosyltransferase involved in cell wall biosynthesis
MKVLFVINSLRPRSGTERVAVDLANFLANFKDNDIVIANRDTDKEHSAYPISENVDIIPLTGNYFSFFMKLKENVKNNQYDFLITHNMGRLTLLCLFLSKYTKIVSLEHSSFVSRSVFVRFLSSILYHKVHQVVALTHHESRKFLSLNNNVLRIPNFSSYYDPHKNVPERKKNIAISVGRLDENKNNIHILKAWQNKIHLLHDWELHIYGDGEQKDILVKYAAENNLSNVYFKGVTQEPNLVYEQASFFLMSSKFEGLPMVLIEAQCFGLPIISYNCPHGPSDVIHDHVNGFLVENQNIDALATAIEKLTSSPDLLKKFSENSLINAKNYQPEKILDIWNNKVLKG